MFYNFEEEEQKVLYEYELGDLPSLSEEELLSVGAVNFMCCLNDEEDSNEFVKWLLKLKEKTSKNSRYRRKRIFCKKTYCKPGTFRGRSVHCGSHIDQFA